MDTANTGKLFVIEGLDGSGKSTQLPLVSAALAQAGLSNTVISFPNYDNPSSALVQMYLQGAFGTDASAVNPYAVSCFYAVDRFAGFQTEWKSQYESGQTILSGRYVTSNAIYQMCKLPHDQWEIYLQWLNDFEYGKLALPRPDRVVFLDMPEGTAQRLLSKRYQQNEDKKDIHERNLQFLSHCREAALFAAKQEGWTVISCTENGILRTPEDMTQRIVAALLQTES